MRLKRKAVMAVVAIAATIGLMTGTAAAATVQTTVYGPQLPQTVPQGYSLYFQGVAAAQPNATSACTTFTVSGAGAVHAYLYGEPSGQTFASPGTRTYCSSHPNVVNYARGGRATAVFTVASGIVTFNAVGITIKTGSPG